MITCFICQGTGKVLIVNRQTGKRDVPSRYPCGTCQGTGTIIGGK